MNHTRASDDFCLLDTCVKSTSIDLLLNMYERLLKMIVRFIHSPS